MWLHFGTAKEEGSGGKQSIHYLLYLSFRNFTTTINLNSTRLPNHSTRQKMKKELLTLAAVASICGAGLNAQTIGSGEMDRLQKSFVKDAPTRAIQNALTTNSNIKAQALNRELQGKIDHYFKYKVDVKGITDQKQSGRCWMFTSMNVIRPAVMKKYNINEFDFSHNFLYFYDILEKSNLFLENIIRTAKEDIASREVMALFSAPVNDGGVWNLYMNIAPKYGLVPTEVMPETEHSNNTAQMTNLVNESLRRTGMSIRHMAEGKAKEAQLRERKMEGLEDIYRILALCLGEPPVQFTWRYEDTDGNLKELKDYTPMQFYKEVTPEAYAPANYVMLMNDPTRPYYKMYEIQNYRNSVEGMNWVYLNLPNDELKSAALASIKANEAMYASCDVGKFLNIKAGINDPEMYDFESLLGVELDMDKSDRIWSRQSGSSHAMTLVACDVDENEKPVKWQFENSWGAESGHKGYLTFTDSWFDEYMFRLVIRKDFLSEKALKAAESKPVQLPMWDFMF